MKQAVAKNSDQALPQPAAMTPASAGPTARETLKATAPSATARGRSSRPTISLIAAPEAGM